VTNIFERLFGSSRNVPGRTLGGFVDSLLQSFENRRAGLSNEKARAGGPDLEAYFLEFYEEEVPRLRETIAVQELALSDNVRDELFRKVDDLIRKVVIPAYARAAGPFTLGERNDFYLTPGALHGMERLAFGVGGIILGAFAIWAPFIPIWSKEWILPFAIAGLMFPNLRRWLSLRRYQAELNGIVVRADDEVWRMEMAYVTGEGLSTRRRHVAEEDPEGALIEERLKAADPAAPSASRKKLKGGDR
jgi:hypothetical protein